VGGEIVSRTIHRLTDRTIRAAKPKPGKRVMLADGGNLLLQVTGKPDGEFSRSWVFRYERDGKRHDLGLGSLNTLSLAEARERTRGLRVQLLDGIDPWSAREQQRKDRLAQLAERARMMTFRECAVQCIESHADGWRNAEHHRQWITSLGQYVYPLLGDLPVDEIATPHIVKVLEAIWKDKPETASRVRGRIERILGWAQVRGFRSGDNPARWRGHLQELFPSKGKIQKTKHHPAMPFTDVAALMVELRAHNSLTALALEFCILTATRSGEVLGAKWSEFDIVSKTWTIPASRMKANKEHRVPLSDRAVKILANLPRDDELVFPLTHTSMLELLRRMGHDNATVHGFRSTFRDWAAERTSYPNHVAEAALAHAVADKVEKAYRRTDLFEKRRRLMSDWAAWCSRPASVESGKVVSLKGRG
jgi:integrase